MALCASTSRRGAARISMPSRLRRAYRDALGCATRHHLCALCIARPGGAKMRRNASQHAVLGRRRGTWRKSGYMSLKVANGLWEKENENDMTQKAKIHCQISCLYLEERRENRRENYKSPSSAKIMAIEPVYERHEKRKKYLNEIMWLAIMSLSMKLAIQCRNVKKWRNRQWNENRVKYSKWKLILSSMKKCENVKISAETLCNAHLALAEGCGSGNTRRSTTWKAIEKSMSGYSMKSSQS